MSKTHHNRTKSAVRLQPEATLKPARKPSRLVALACAAVVVAYDRRWLAQPVAVLLGPGDPAPETLSRLKAKLLGPLEAMVARLHRRGRRSTTSEASSLRAEREALRAMLELAASVIDERGVRGRALQDRLVAAQAALAQKHGTTLRDFCSSLGIPERTFRSWRNRKQKPLQPPPAPALPPKPRPRRNEGRFDLGLCPPGLQAMADTTHIRAFGVDLQIVGAQDPGLRHKQLLEQFRVTEQENANTVIDVLTRACADLPGSQFITDQGTPYIAKATQAACERLDVEDAPQVEGTPTDKAPLERAWRTIKDALAPLLGLTDRAAEVAPALSDPNLAKALVTLLLGVYLRVFAGGRRHLGHPLEGQDPAALDDAVERAREAARAEGRSRKLLLGQIHAQYNLGDDISVDRFVRAHRHHDIDDIHAAERILRNKACRCQTRLCDRYFAGILRNVAEQGRHRRARQRTDRQEQRARDTEQARFDQQDRFLAAHPEQRMWQALDALEVQWDADAGRLTFGGKGWGRGTLVRALHELRDRHPGVWTHDFDAVLENWWATAACPQNAKIAIRALAQGERDRILLSQPNPSHPATPGYNQLVRPEKHGTKPRPHPPPDLTI